MSLRTRFYRIAHTRQAIFQPIKDIVVKLLLRGCNPNAVDEDDHTPSDLALSSSAWLLWCDALQAAGLAPDGVLKEDDRVHNVVLDNVLLDGKYSEWLESLPPRCQIVRDEPSQPEQSFPSALTANTRMSGPKHEHRLTPTVHIWSKWVAHLPTLHLSTTRTEAGVEMEGNGCHVAANVIGKMAALRIGLGSRSALESTLPTGCGSTGFSLIPLKHMLGRLVH